MWTCVRAIARVFGHRLQFLQKHDGYMVQGWAGIIQGNDGRTERNKGGRKEQKRKLKKRNNTGGKWNKNRRQ